MNNNQWGVLSLKTVYHEKEEAAMVPAPVLTRERERERKRKELLGGTSEWWL